MTSAESIKREIASIDFALNAQGLPTYSAMREQRNELMTVALGYQLVRAAQRAYFESRTQENLIASKQAEKALDAQARAAIEKATS